MRARVHESSPSRRTLEVEVPAEEVRQEKERVARSYARKLKLPGFRKGRTPPSLVGRRFQKEIEGEVIERLTKDYSWKIIDEHKLVPLHQPVVEEYHYGEGEPLTFRATFEVRPAITLGNYRGLETVRRRAPVTAEVVERHLETLREQNARLEAVEGRPLAEGDVAIADLQPLDGQGRPSGELRRGATLDLGGSEIPEEIRSQMAGLEVGAERELDLPGDSPPGPSPATPPPEARTRRWRVTLRAIRRKVLPPLDDGFAGEVGDFESLEALRVRLREDLERRSEERADEEVREDLVRQLVASHPFEVPQVLVERQLDRMLESLARALAPQGVDPKRVDWDGKRRDLEEHARTRVRADLILDEIAGLEGLEVGDEELLDVLTVESARSRTSPQALRARLEREGRLDSLKTKMLREKSLDLVVGSANIISKGPGP